MFKCYVLYIKNEKRSYTYNVTISISYNVTSRVLHTYKDQSIPAWKTNIAF